MWGVHYHAVSEVFVVTTSVARAAELPVVQRPVSLITSPVLEPWQPTTWWPTTSPHVYWEVSAPLLSSQEQGNTPMTAASGHLNQSPFSIETLHLTYPPPSFLAFSRLGFTSFEPLGQRSVYLPGRHSNSWQHQMSSELADHDEGRQRKQDWREKNSRFVKHTLSLFLCFRSVSGRGEFNCSWGECYGFVSVQVRLVLWGAGAQSRAVV